MDSSIVFGNWRLEWYLCRFHENKKTKKTKLPRHNKLIGVGTLSDFKMPIKQKWDIQSISRLPWKERCVGKKMGTSFLKNFGTDAGIPLVSTYILEATPWPKLMLLYHRPPVSLHTYSRWPKWFAHATWYLSLQSFCFFFICRCPPEFPFFLFSWGFSRSHQFRETAEHTYVCMYIRYFWGGRDLIFIQLFSPSQPPGPHLVAASGGGVCSLSPNLSSKKINHACSWRGSFDRSHHGLPVSKMRVWMWIPNHRRKMATHPLSIYKIPSTTSSFCPSYPVHPNPQKTIKWRDIGLHARIIDSRVRRQARRFNADQAVLVPFAKAYDWGYVPLFRPLSNP